MFGLDCGREEGIRVRVLLVNQYVGTPDTAGGTRHYSLARQLIRRGHEVTMVTASFSHMLRQERLGAGQRLLKQVRDGIHLIWLRTPGYDRNGPRRFVNMLAFARQVGRLPDDLVGGRPDVVVGSSPQPFAALAAEGWARTRGIPFVLEVRDLWPQTLVDLGQMSPAHPVVLALTAVERTLYRRARRIISLLSGAGEHMAAKGADPAKVTWIPNGVDLDLVPYRPPEPGPRFTIIYAGAHGLSNNLDSVIAAACRLRDAGWADRLCIRFIGDGPEKPRLRERAAREGVSFVQFEPPVPKEQIFGVLQEADAFIIATQNTDLYRWGYSPNKLFDYLAAGRPIICALRSPYDAVTEAGAGLTVPPDDPEAMAAAIIRMAEAPPEVRRAMGERGRAYAQAHHSFGVLGERFERVLMEVVS